MKRKYIVTADDYGMCPEVNEAIEKLSERGMLSTTNVLMNFDCDFSDAPLRSYSNYSVGLHWNVTTGKPITDVSKIPSLVDQDGVFHSLNEFRRRFRKGMIDKAELDLELQNQFDAFYKWFGQPDYWNTHENSALYPLEYKVFEKIALRNHIEGTRNFQRVYIDYDLSGGAKRRLREWIVKTFVNVWFGVLAKKKFKMPAGRIVTFQNISKTDIERMRMGLNNTDKESVEIIIHPATSGDNPLFGNIATDRVIEFEKYMSDEFMELFQNDHAEIVSFSAL